MKARIASSSRLSLVCLTLAIVAMLSSLIDGRYLPTRADESEVAALKNLITNILDEAQQHEHERQLERDRERRQLLVRSTRFFSTQNNPAKQLARQYYPTAISRPSEEDQSNRMLLEASFLHRRSAELMPPVELVDLDGSDPMQALRNADKLSIARKNQSQVKVGDKADR